ncbi:hypothetical protein HU200_025608 [Digitaria exilis]|uniref:Uncharacterized protein n=1 Tax=Digitaria exilis TaxID=1010633 RepID=A0A835C2M3_9POAL|nr:hypothetical protein HU200_025608 [Digitaria exilis]
MASRSYGSREGLTVRPAASSGSSEISLQIDPINADLDDHILGLRGQVRKLRGVSTVEFPMSGTHASEFAQFYLSLKISNQRAKYQNDFISQLVVLVQPLYVEIPQNSCL